MAVRCVIVGAGISGLALADALCARGIEPLVLESAPRAGGKIETRNRGELVVECGPAGFLDREPAMMRLASSLGLRVVDALPAARRRAVLAGGNLLEVPRGPRDLLSTTLLSAHGKLRLLGDLFVRRSKGRGDESVGAFARRRLGSEAAERVFFPLVSGLYAGDPDRISLAAAFPWLARLEAAHRSLLIGAARELGGRRAGSRLRTFASGMEELPRALARRLGNTLRLGAAVRALSATPAGWRLSVDEQGAASELEAPAIALAVPAYEAARLVASVSPAAHAATSAIEYVPVILVYLAYRVEQLAVPADLYGFLSARGGSTRLLGAVFHSAAFPARAPQGTVLVSARLGGARDPAIGALNDAQLVGLAHQELAALLRISGAPLDTQVIRHARALPQYTIGHTLRLALLDDAERACPGLFFAGNAYRGLGVPDCVAAATRRADEIAAYLSAQGVDGKRGAREQGERFSQADLRGP